MRTQKWRNSTRKCSDKVNYYAFSKFSEKLGKQKDQDIEMDEDDLLAELGEMDEEGQEETKKQIEELKADAIKFKKLALHEKKNKNIEEAKKNLIKCKKIEKDIEDLYKMYPKLRPVTQQVT